MKIVEWLFSQKFYLISNLICISITSFILHLFNFNSNGIIFIAVIYMCFLIMNLVQKYMENYLYLKDIDSKIEKLDKKFLISEMIHEPKSFVERFIYDIISVTNKSMNDEIFRYKKISSDYCEYIETWVHEIKVPLAASKLIIENNKNEITLSVDEELDKLDSYIEQALFYTRSNHLEKDYVIKNVNLKSLVSENLKKYSKFLINYKCKIEMNDLDIDVKSDKKWMNFILGQIIVNSIKYRKDEMKLTFSVIRKENSIILQIRDNGIGISDKEIGKVFLKGYVGSNGRRTESSTGIGLYLCDKLCSKMNVGITLDSKYNDHTTVSICFPTSGMYRSY